MIFRDGIFYFYVLALVLLLLFLFLWWRRSRKKEPLELPVIAASVEEICSEESEDSDDSALKYTAGVIYSYKVGGEVYRGMHDWPELYDSSEEAREKIKYRIGDKIQVQYDPANPQYSYLDE